jgi:hypothetical protein
MKNYSTNLRETLTSLAIIYAKINSISGYSKYKTAVVFKALIDNFQLDSYKAILLNPDWKARLGKPHQRVKGAKELQASNSSDGLLMNIFCYPKIKEWKSIAILFGLAKITTIEFGYNPTLLLNGKPEPRSTEVDLVINESILCEAKLSETDFTNEVKAKIESYEYFTHVFDYIRLPQTEEEYLNYQLIRNILAAYKEEKQFILLCDMRRPDLIQSFYQTVICIKDINLRKRCSFITWQDIAKSVGGELKQFLRTKYGIY